MRVFKDKRTARKFTDLYYTLPEDKQRLFGKKVRALADEKITGDGDEFYVTSQDLVRILESMTS